MNNKIDVRSLVCGRRWTSSDDDSIPMMEVLRTLHCNAGMEKGRDEPPRQAVIKSRNTQREQKQCDAIHSRRAVFLVVDSHWMGIAKFIF